MSATDQTGRPLLGLQPDDLLIENAGVPCDILAVRPASYPVALVVDTSGYARADLRVIHTAIDRFVDGLEPRSIAVYTSGPPTSRVQDFTTDVSRVSSAAAHLFAAPEGTTHLLDAVVSASRGLATRHAPVTGIVAISAGGLEMSPPTVEQVRTTLNRSRTILHVVERQSLRLDRGVHQSGDQVFELLSRATHGQFIRGASDAIYSSGLAAVRRQLDGELVVEYAATSGSSRALKLALRQPGQIAYAISIEAPGRP